MSFLNLMKNGNAVYFDGNLDNLTQDMIDAYASADPFPHAVINDFLPLEIVRDLATNFPRVNPGESFDRNQERYKKSFNPDDLDSGFLRSVFYSLNSRPFLEFLEKLTGITGIIPDPYYIGGGFHQTDNGGHLGIHADFNLHKKLKLKRRINALVYLNEDWQEAYGGNLDLWDKDMKHKVQSVAPQMNRCVIFSTGEDTWHGHPDPLNTPEGVSRRSIALYYYTASDAVFQEHRDFTTLFKKRKGSSDSFDLRLKLKHFLKDITPPVVLRTLKRLVGRGKKQKKPGAQKGRNRFN